MFDRVGGEAGIEQLVHGFYDRVLADPELNPFFKHVPMEKLLSMQKEFFSEALDGPLFYSGRSLREVHQGHEISKRHLRRFTDHLLATLESRQKDLGLTEQDVNAIHSRIAMEADEIAGESPGESG